MTEDRLVEIAERIYAVDPSVPRIQRIRSDGKRGALRRGRSRKDSDGERAVNVINTSFDKRLRYAEVTSAN